MAEPYSSVGQHMRQEEYEEAELRRRAAEERRRAQSRKENMHSDVGEQMKYERFQDDQRKRDEYVARGDEESRRRAIEERMGYDAAVRDESPADPQAVGEALHSFRVPPSEQQVAAKMNELRQSHGEATAQAFAAKVEQYRAKQKPVDIKQTPPPVVDQSLRKFQRPPTDEEIAAERDRLRATHGAAAANQFQRYAVALRANYQLRDKPPEYTARSDKQPPLSPSVEASVMRQQTEPTRSEVIGERDRLGGTEGRQYENYVTALKNENRARQAPGAVGGRAWDGLEAPGEVAGDGGRAALEYDRATEAEKPEEKVDRSLLGRIKRTFF